MEKSTITTFAETTFRNRRRKFGIKTDDRRRHMYLIGKTGMGKSTILENMIIDDIRGGHGVAVVDPHGDLAEKVMEFIPNNRINDVIYFNPADMDYPIAFNVVEQVEPHLRHLVASGLIGVFQKLWADSWGPRLEYILRNAILAILDYPGSTLLAVTRMLSDKSFRKKVIEKVQDPVVKAFWVNEFAGYNDKFASEAVSPIQNKVGQFLSSSLIRNIVGQVRSTIDMRKIMDDGKILILNLSKGRIGEDNSSLLGAMMITKIQLAAMSRVDTEEHSRKDFYLYVDEFQNFTSDSFANILSEARKYRLNLILAHQYIEQLGETVRNAVFGNVGTLIVFRVGAADAEALVPEFTPTFTAEDILNLPKYEIYLKLMIDGVASEPFSAKGLMPLMESEKTGNLEKVIKVCREKYAKKKEDVEEKIAKWHELSEEDIAENNGNKKKKEKKLDPEIYKYPAKCARCEKETMLPFEPDGVRPIFCKDCLSLSKEERKIEMENRQKAKKEELKTVEKTEKTEKNLVSTPAKQTNQADKQNKPEKKPIKVTEKKEVVPEISLNDALGMQPVKFGTGEKKKEPQAQKTEKQNHHSKKETPVQKNQLRKAAADQNKQVSKKQSYSKQNTNNFNNNNADRQNNSRVEKQNFVKENSVKSNNHQKNVIDSGDLTSGGEISFD